MEGSEFGFVFRGLMVGFRFDLKLGFCEVFVHNFGEGDEIVVVGLAEIKLPPIFPVYQTRVISDGQVPTVCAFSNGRERKGES